LALWQAEQIIGAIRATSGVDAVVEIISTHGDRRTDVPLWQIGGKGVFVKEVQAAVLDGRADMAVHSAKDLPAQTPDELIIGAVPPRGNPGDVLVGCRLADLAPGAVVATGSARRRAQLAHHRPDLTFVELRGNIGTRLTKAVDGVAIVMAGAALERLDLAPPLVDPLDHDVMLPQVGQGALAVECGAKDTRVAEVLAQIDHVATRRELTAERSFLLEVGGDCSLPLGAYATGGAGAEVSVTALLCSLDGHVAMRHQTTGADPEDAGRRVARHLLDDAGGSSLLAPSQP
jgi:hydroxymethylbilane synthase